MKKAPYTGRPGDEPEASLEGWFLAWSWIRGIVLVALLLLLGHVLEARPFVVTYKNLANPSSEAGEFLYPVFSLDAGLTRQCNEFPGIGPGQSRTLTLSLAGDVFWVYNSNTGWVSHDVTGISDAMMYHQLVSGVYRQVLVLGSPVSSGGLWEWPSGAVDATVTVPGLGAVEIPSWVTNPALQMFFAGIACAAGVSLVRAGLRWFRRADGVHAE